MIEESNKPGYNGWIVFLLVIAAIFKKRRVVGKANQDARKRRCGGFV